MADRQESALLRDILEAIGRIQTYIRGLSYPQFLMDLKTQDAVVRNLEIIGEAAKRVSPASRRRASSVPWQDIGAMRDRLIHQYFGTNWEIVWDVIQAKLPELEREVAGLIDTKSH